MAVTFVAEALIDVVHKGLGAYVIPGEHMVYVRGEADAILSLAGLTQGLGAQLPLPESFPLRGVILFALNPG